MDIFLHTALLKKLNFIYTDHSIHGKCITLMSKKYYNNIREKY